MRKLFNEFDKDGDGIGVDELATIIGKVESGSSKQTSREEIQSIFEEADADGGGLIGFDEFKAEELLLKRVVVSLVAAVEGLHSPLGLLQHHR